ncbi:hypothetical protein JXQ70_08915 [bacterium]|nr:hypothetical protein [bacterium]
MRRLTVRQRRSVGRGRTGQRYRSEIAHEVIFRETSIIHYPILTVSEVKRIMDQPDLSTRSDYRDRAMLETCYSTGIRRLVLINLTIYRSILDCPSLTPFYIRSGCSSDL